MIFQTLQYLPTFDPQAVDYARTWYTLGTWFDAHPELEVHNADGSLAVVPNGDDGTWDWHVFDFGQADARAAWVLDIAQTVSDTRPYDVCAVVMSFFHFCHQVWTAAPDGQRLFDGIFIDGYRGNTSWTSQLIPAANATTQAAWLAGVTAMGPALAAALPALPSDGFVRLINPGAELGSYPGYNANSIEFFDPSQGSIQALVASAQVGHPQLPTHPCLPPLPSCLPPPASPKIRPGCSRRCTPTSATTWRSST